MTTPNLPKLHLHHGSSALAISQDSPNAHRRSYHHHSSPLTVFRTPISNTTTTHLSPQHTDTMTTPNLPKLHLHHGSSALAISQDSPLPNLPTHMKFPPLTIHASPKTDLWRKPPHTDVDNAPTILLSCPIDLHKFHSAKVTVSAAWGNLYDQGGLVLFIPDEDLKKWVKTGIEYTTEPVVSTVATSRWSDWSLLPLPPAVGEGAEGKERKVTIQVERETKGEERVESLWIYTVDEATGEKRGIREITWWFRHDIDGDDKSDVEAPRTLLIGVYAARPTVPMGEGREEEELVVHFKDFEVTLFDD